MAYDANSKYFYSNIFQSTNVSVAGPYVKKLSRTKYGSEAYFKIRQHFMDDDEINRAKEKYYLSMEAARYCGELQHFT